MREAGYNVCKSYPGVGIVISVAYHLEYPSGQQGVTRWDQDVNAQLYS